MQTLAEFPVSGASKAPNAPPEQNPETSAAAERERGPLRPEGLAATRLRLRGAVIARRLRALDLVIVLLTTPLALLGAGRPLLEIPLRVILPPAVGAVLVLMGLHLARAYDLSARETLRRHLFKAAVGGLLGAAPAVWLADLDGARIDAASRWALAVSAAALLTHGLDWALVRRWRRAGRLTPNVVVVGATANARRLIEAAMSTGDVAVLGVFDDRMSRIPTSIHGVRVLGDTEALMSHRLLPYIDHVIITVTPSARKRVSALVDRLKFLPNRVTLFMEHQGAAAQRRTLTRLGWAPLAQVSGQAEDEARALSKRAQDLLLGALLLVLAAPAMLIIAVLIRLGGEGPVLFRQRRHGFNNEIIEVLKFRTMRAASETEASVRQVSPNDERVTPVGRWLRRLSLDELPQLWNVLRGDMSLVGPRPHAIGMKAAGRDAERLVAEYAWRHRMKPGLTGWAQVNGSIGPVDAPELVRRRVALDIDYIERQSLLFDLLILALTPRALLRAARTVR
jgi:exopolysaccharide biosynthesis polyprenyl glycosylphosphotransferase